MADSAPNGTIEVVRGHLGDERAGQILRFWSSRGALDGDEARRRLAEVVCVLVDDAGEIAGVNSAYAAEVPLIAGRRFWVYRSLLAGGASESGPAMIRAAFRALEAEFDRSGDVPLGLCVPVADPQEMERRPDAEWADPRILFAGHLADGRQARIGYFAGAEIGEGFSVPEAAWPLEPRYRIGLLAERDDVDDQAVVDFWTREAALPQEEAVRRVSEVLLVATSERDELVGVCTAYLQRNAQLGMNMWYLRGFVAEAHRHSSIGVNFALTARDHLKRRFVSRGDMRGAGIVFEVENEGLRRINDATWLPTDFTFIGENQRGDHLRVHYFPGARAPEPPR